MPGLAAHRASGLRSQILCGLIDVLDFFRNAAKGRNAQPSTHNSALISEKLFFVSVEMIHPQS